MKWPNPYDAARAWCRQYRSLRLALHGQITTHVQRVLEKVPPDVPVLEKADEEGLRQSEARIDHLEKALEMHLQKLPSLFLLMLLTVASTLLAWPVYEFLTGSGDRLDIVLLLETSEVHLRPERPASSARIAEIESLSVSGLHSFEFKDHEASSATVDLSSQTGQIVFESTSLSAQTWIRLSAKDGVEEFHLSSADELRISLAGMIDVDEPPLGRQELSFPELIRLKPGVEPVKAVFKRRAQMRGGQEAQGAQYARPWSFEPMDLSGLKLLFHRSAERDRLYSGVLGGTLIIENLAGQAYEIRAGEAVRLHGARGELPLLEGRGDRLALRFVGSVDDVTLGYRSPRSLKPSRLDLFMADQGALRILQLIGALVSILTLIMSLIWFWLRR